MDLRGAAAARKEPREAPEPKKYSDFRNFFNRVVCAKVGGACRPFLPGK